MPIPKPKGTLSLALSLTRLSAQHMGKPVPPPKGTISFTVCWLPVEPYP